MFALIILTLTTLDEIDNLHQASQAGLSPATSATPECPSVCLKSSHQVQHPLGPVVVVGSSAQHPPDPVH